MIKELERRSMMHRCRHCGIWMEPVEGTDVDLCQVCLEDGVGKSYKLTLLIVVLTTVLCIWIMVGASYGAEQVLKTKCSWHTYANGERKFECTTRTITVSQQPRPQFTYPQPTRPHYTDRRRQ